MHTYSIFFSGTTTPNFFTLSLHDALPISSADNALMESTIGLYKTELIYRRSWRSRQEISSVLYRDRKSTRLNSSHVAISYAVFCLKKKKNYIEEELIVEEIETRSDFLYK